MKEEIEVIIEKLIQKNGGTRGDYLNILKQIGYHESGGSFDPLTKQKGGGPGRGIYQFEVGDAQEGKTAANRTISFYKNNAIPVPQWLKNTTSNKSIDVSTFNKEQQDIMLLSNIEMYSKANDKPTYSDLLDGKIEMAEFWATNHWKGESKDLTTRLNSFKRSQKSLGEPLRVNPAKEFPKEAYNIDYTEERTTLADNTNISIPEIVDDRVKNFEFDVPRRSVNDLAVEPPQEYNEKIDPTSEEQQNYTQWVQEYLNDNQFNYGGYVNTEGKVNEFNVGGTHDQNPYGGIPQGMGKNNRMNTVEEGESSFKFKEGKYIFSNRIKL